MSKQPEPSAPEPRRGWSPLWVTAAAIAVVLLLVTIWRRSPQAATLSYSAFYDHLEEGRVASVMLSERRAEGTFTTAQTIDGKRQERFVTQLPAQTDPALMPLLHAQEVSVEVSEEQGSIWLELLGGLLPWLLILGAWYWLSRSARRALGAGGKGSWFGGLTGGPPKKRFVKQEAVDVRFDDVAGAAAAKRDLDEVIQAMRDPDRFARLGGRMPRGVLLVGSPGTGKTLLARAVAGEAGVPFFSISGSEFIELFVGMGASRVRDLFEAAKKAAPAIIFIDEIDAVGRSRGTGLGGGHDEREQTLNQLLAAMDGFERDGRVVVMAATNRPDVLDPALLRPGRFDRRVVVELPERAAREAILRVHTRDKPIASDVDLETIARSTPGWSGADLANLVNEAALAAIRRGAETITASDFATAQDKVQLGDPRETHLSEAEKHRVAAHEAGHALVAHEVDAAAPVRRVSIIPRGMALGATQQLAQDDKHLHTKRELEAKLRVLLAGYAAEELVFGEVSNGAENDLKRANEIAQRMVAQFGMSERLGPVFHEHRQDHPFLGARIATESGLSDATVHEIEMEARALVLAARDDARSLLARERRRLERLIDGLREHETLEGAELAAWLGALSAGAPAAAESAA